MLIIPFVISMIRLLATAEVRPIPRICHWLDDITGIKDYSLRPCFLLYLIDCQHASGSSNSTNIVPKLTDVTFEGPVKDYGSKAR